MAVYFSFLLIVFGLTGMYSITTVSKVSVKAEHSLTIPCIYDSRYKNHVKYLCKGYYWLHCSYEIKTNQPHRSGKFSISDDKTKRTFTVTIKDLMDKDTDYYWCAVEIDGGADVKESFHLSVTSDTPSLYVDRQEITGFNGDNVTIQFHSSNSGEIKWCRLGSSCVTGSSGSIDRTRVTIGVKAHNVVNVTMSGLMTESSGWYLCVKGDLQMPVHLTVTEKPSTTMLSPSADETPVSTDKANNRSKNGQHRATVDLKSLIIPLILLIVIVMATLFIWFKLKKYKQSKVKSSATVMAEEELTYCDVKHKSETSDQAGDDVTYCNVGYVRGTLGQMSHTDVDVMYSSVVIKKTQSVKRVEAQDQNATYSMMTQH